MKNEQALTDEYDDMSMEELAFHALHAARVAFEKYFEDQGMDAAYFDYKFIAWTLDSNFDTRLSKVVLEHEVKQ